MHEKKVKEGSYSAGGPSKSFTTFQEQFWPNARAVCFLWCTGLLDGIGFHRCLVYFVYDQQILIAQVKAGQCLVLNGFIFLGSILLWDFGLSPGAKWLLQISLHGQENTSYVEVVHTLLCALFCFIWLLPVYVLSFSLSCIWYLDIAKLALKVKQEKENPSSKSRAKIAQTSQDQDVMVQVAQELYRVVLFAVFMMQTYLIGLLPGIGMVTSFVLLSLLNAFYSFDYKWSLSRRTLEERVLYFECHWAYFAGFGSVCTLATVLWPFFISAAVMALLYPLFILIACDADPGKAYKQVLDKEKRRGQELTRIRLPIFYSATRLTSWVIDRAPEIFAASRQYLNYTILITAASVLSLLLGAAYMLRS